MTKEEILQTGKYHLDRNAFVLGKEPMIYHCHHYNVFLQMSIENTKEYIDVDAILTDSAQEVAYAQFHNLFQGSSVTIEERKQVIKEFYKTSGFGLIDLIDCNKDGGVVETNQEHYAVGWKNRFGLRKKEESGVGYFTRGFLAGALEAVFDLKLGTLHTTQTKCLAKGDDISKFEITIRDEETELSESPAEGNFQTFFEYPTHENIDYKGIRELMTNTKFESNENGFIEHFGVMLTKHYANYYNLISLRTMLTMEKEFGEAGVNIVQELLKEAAHVCVFNTFGGLMLSAEWNAIIKPMIKERNDWMHGVVACINSMGWGLWEIQELNPKGVTALKVTSSYESNAFKKLYDENTHYPVCCFVSGALSGIMNLIYHGDITQNPTLDEDYYHKIFKKKGKFVSKQVKCKTMGDELDLFEAVRS